MAPDAEPAGDDPDLAVQLTDRAVDSLYDLLAGLRASGLRGDGAPTRDVQRALVATLLRVVFLLHAEARGLLAEEVGCGPPRSVTALFARLSRELAQDARAMDHRHAAWADLLTIFRHVHARRGGRFFDPSTHPVIERTPGLTDRALHGVLERLLIVDGAPVAYEDLEVEQLGSVHEAVIGFAIELTMGPSIAVRPHHVVVDLRALLATPGEARAAWLAEVADCSLGSRASAALANATSVDDLVSALQKRRSPRTPSIVPAGALVLQPSEDRRRAGAHYTPRALTEKVVRATLAPLLDDDTAILDLTVCDPAMGSGAFLVEACRQLGDALVAAWDRRGGPPSVPPGVASVDHARALVAERCLHGVDRNAAAVDLAKVSIWLVARASHRPLSFLDGSLRCDDALVGVDAAPPPRAFSAMIGNPPWVSYAGRAAQPLADDLRRFYLARYASFAGYRNLQGLFVELAARKLRPGGRLGLVLPSSMAELDGYGPTRAALDRFAICDPALPDLGEDAFRGVFQPCMVLLATARDAPLLWGSDAAWPIERPDVDAFATEILRRFEGPTLPADLFGERGLQTQGEDRDHLDEAPGAAHATPLRAGSDIQAFRRGPASRHADRAWFGGRLRADAEWTTVRVLVRQTARVPIAALSDGIGFRNSILAAFASDAYPAAFLVAYLNASPIRWHHYFRHRDARLGMPQVKIGHLRSIPAPPASLVPVLAALGERLSARNDGITLAEQEELDRLVAEAFSLTADQQARIARDRAAWT